MVALFWLLDTVLWLGIWALIIAAVLSMLLAFGVLDRRNGTILTIADMFDRVTEPMLRPIRRVLPYFGNVDLSPLVLILLLQAARILLAEIAGSVGVMRY